MRDQPAGVFAVIAAANAEQRVMLYHIEPLRPHLHTVLGGAVLIADLRHVRRGRHVDRSDSRGDNADLGDRNLQSDQKIESENCEGGEQTATGSREIGCDQQRAEHDQAQRTGKPAEAALAYAKAVKLLPARADVQAGYAEALVSVAGDTVTPEAKGHIDTALRLDPKEPRARFLASLYKAQNGQERAALDEWIALSNSASADVPWQVDLRQRVEKLAAKLGVNVAGRLVSAPSAPLTQGMAPLSGPNPAQMAAASSLPLADQQSMIDGMVNGLAAKLKANPNDAEGWLKLIRSRVVLKDMPQAKADLATARKTFASQPAKLAQVNALASELGL